MWQLNEREFIQGLTLIAPKKSLSAFELRADDKVLAAFRRKKIKGFVLSGISTFVLEAEASDGRQWICTPRSGLASLESFEVGFRIVGDSADVATYKRRLFDIPKLHFSDGRTFLWFYSDQKESFTGLASAEPPTLLVLFNFRNQSSIEDGWTIRYHYTFTTIPDSLSLLIISSYLALLHDCFQ